MVSPTIIKEKRKIRTNVLTPVIRRPNHALNLKQENTEIVKRPDGMPNFEKTGGFNLKSETSNMN